MQLNTKIPIMHVWHQLLREEQHPSTLSFREDGLHHPTDKGCHFSFGHLCYPVGSSLIAGLLPVLSFDADAAQWQLPMDW